MDAISFSFVMFLILYYLYLLYYQYYLLNSHVSFLLNIFIGALREMSMPLTSPSCTLSSSQNRAFQYICQIMSTMEPIPTDYVEQELDDNEQCSVSQTIV